MEGLKIAEGEYKFACIVWDNEPVKSTELVKLSFEKLGWKKATVYTVLRKLCLKGILKNENAVVTSLVKREEVQMIESRLIVERSFNNSLPAFLSAFLKDRKLNFEEAEEIKRIIEEACDDN
ncbi:BlaI/MecI/CopY family transcriptional regulator [Anaerotignum faecicola]|nr:BlaI/MecI/CopY family transcriptional regulator [Anaerotignum faecicola]